jgi:hypothetical protein
MLFTGWITKVTHTHTHTHIQYMQYSLLSCGDNGYANAP